MKMRHSLLAVLVITSTAVVGASIVCGRGDEKNCVCLALVKKLGWKEEFNMGNDIIRNLSTLGDEQKKQFNVRSFRGRRAAFCGSGAPPGATNDLMTSEGFYLRIISRESRDLRPTAAAWNVIICGNVMQVFPENKIIVIEVRSTDWIVLDTK
jgi:hypothetical protein